MGRPNIKETLKKEFEKTSKIWLSAPDVSKILDERYAIPISTKNVCARLTQLIREGYLIRRKMQGKRVLAYEYKKR